MRIEHFGISVTDIKRSAKWYLDIFDFEKIKEFEKSGLQIKGTVIKKGNLSIEILETVGAKRNTSW